jgi:hypothetical protein
MDGRKYVTLGAFIMLAASALLAASNNASGQHCQYNSAFMVAFKMQMIGYTKAQYTHKDQDRLTRAVSDTLTVEGPCVAIAFVSDEPRHKNDKEASIMVGVTVMAKSAKNEKQIRHRFTEPTIQREFANNLKKEGEDHAIEESVGGKMVRIGGHALFLGAKVAIVAGVILFIVGCIKLYQLKSGSGGGGYDAIPGA